MGVPKWVWWSDAVVLGAFVGQQGSPHWSSLRGRPRNGGGKRGSDRGRHLRMEQRGRGTNQQFDEDGNVNTWAAQAPPLLPTLLK
eukprot:3200632-Pyramimonas_sp.AAC.1